VPSASKIEREGTEHGTPAYAICMQLGLVWVRADQNRAVCLAEILNSATEWISTKAVSRVNAMKELSPREQAPFTWGIVVGLCSLAAPIAIIAIARGWL
jgi:hypothetical protein